MKLGIAGLGHETITFWPGTTGLEAFRRDEFLGRDVVEKRRGTNTSIGGFVDVCESQGVEMHPVCYAFGGVNATVEDEAFDHYIGVMKRGFGEADLDGILLELHGAMVTESLQDTETHIIREIREAVGYDVSIMAALDLHANISPAILEEATMVFGYHSTPHLDRAETGRRAARAMISTARGEIQPTAAITKPGLVVPSVFSFTGAPPGSEIIEHIERWMERPGVIDASVLFSFAWSDVHQLGIAAVALTDGDPQLAREVVDDLSAFSWERRGPLNGSGTLYNLGDGVRRSIERAKDARKPVVLLDQADRTNETTFVLRELLSQGARNAAVPLFWDPEAARAAAEAGEGAMVEFEVGGSTGWRDGGPVKVKGRVAWVGEGRYVGTGPMTKGLQVDQGTTAILDVDGVWLQLVSQRVGITGGALIDEDPITQFGYKTQDFDIIVSKSKTHFRAVYAPLSEEIIVVDAPGQCPSDLRVFEYRNVPPGVYPITTD
jgi:microcystin degradation protein MlrC